MPGSLRKMPVWLPIIILLVAMASIQGGASLAKSLFPLVGAPGVTALRLALGTLMSMEPALAAVSGMIFLGETLTPIQLLALGAIIAASMGSTLTVRKESKIKELDIN
ncbi:hypothetical protein [Escherichia coli]|uniref:hypothetical protein n=1 Tax=Escherichia coli TaxID=562 RepID=UPI000C1BC599|nr:hypothetical protein [Escherichia coli]